MELFLWQIQGQTQMDHNFSLHMQNTPIWIQSIQSLESKKMVKKEFLRKLSNLYLLYRVIDGADSTLDMMEKVPVDEKHRPLQEFRIKSVTIHANPIADKQL